MFFSKKGSKETYPLRPPPLLEPPLELPRDDDLENPEDLLPDLELVLLVLEEFPEDLVLVDLLLEGLVALPVLLPALLVPRVLAVPLFLEYVVLVLEDVLLAKHR